MVSTVSSQQEGSGFEPHLSVWSLHVVSVSTWVPSGILLQSKAMQVGLIGNSKLPVGVNVSMDCCLSLRVSPVMNWRTI